MVQKINKALLAQNNDLNNNWSFSEQGPVYKQTLGQALYGAINIFLYFLICLIIIITVVIVIKKKRKKEKFLGAIIIGAICLVVTLFAFVVKEFMLGMMC